MTAIQQQPQASDSAPVEAASKDADDILQLVALRLLQSSEEQRDRQTMLGWLHAVTRNAIVDLKGVSHVEERACMT